jgi:hypothetical protein
VAEGDPNPVSKKALCNQRQTHGSFRSFPIITGTITDLRFVLISFALRFNGRKRAHGADEIMARITAERLVEHLERSGYVVMCKPGLGPHRVDLGDAIERAMKIRREE